MFRGLLPDSGRRKSARVMKALKSFNGGAMGHIRQAVIVVGYVLLAVAALSLGPIGLLIVLLMWDSREI